MSDILIHPSVQDGEKDLACPKKRFTLCAASCFLFVIVCSIGIPIMGYHVIHNRYQRDMMLAHQGVSDLEAASTVFHIIQHDPFNLQEMYHAQNDFTDALILFTRLNKDLPTTLTRLPIPRLRAAKHLVQLAMEMARAGQATCNILTTMASRFVQYPQIGQESMHDRLTARVGMPRGMYARMPKKVMPAYKVQKDVQGFRMYDVVRLERNLQRITKVLAQADIQMQQLKPTDLQFDRDLGKAVSALRLYLPLVQEGIRRVEALIAIAPPLLGITQPAQYLIEIRSTSSANSNLIGSYSLTLIGGRLIAIHAHTMVVGRKEQFAGTVTITPVLMERILSLDGPLAIPEYHEVVTAQNLRERIRYHQLIESGQEEDTSLSTGSTETHHSFSTLLGIHFVQYLQSLPSSLLSPLVQMCVTSLYSKNVQISFTSPTAQKVLQQMLEPNYLRIINVFRQVERI